MKDKRKSALVIGASGYTGGYLVKHLLDQGYEVWAHIRPDSKSLKIKGEMFTKMGAIVDTTPWTLDAFKTTLKNLDPSTIFSVLGTTKKRKQNAKDPEKETYKDVDYKLTAMVIRAAVEEELHPKFVYLSAVGVSSKSQTKYMQARFHTEEYLALSGLDYTIARPSFISGSDREESRPGERIASVISDSFLGAASLIGFVGLRKKYISIRGEDLALAMICLAQDEAFSQTHADPKDLFGFLKRA